MAKQLSTQMYADAGTKLNSAVSSRRGCSPRVLEVSETDQAVPAVIQFLVGNAAYERHMKFVREKISDIELQLQFLEISVFAKNRHQFIKSAGVLCQLAESIPSDKLLRTAIKARLVSNLTPDSEMIMLLDSIAAEIKRLKKEFSLS